MEWIKKRGSKETNSDAGLTAQAANVSQSPVASGKNITQNITTNNHYYPLEQTSEQEKRERSRANIKFSAADIIHIEESLYGGVFLERSQGITAAVLRFSNDAVVGAENAATRLKATLSYRSTGKEILRVVGCWLDHSGGEIYFDVDDSHALLVGVILKDELFTIEQHRVPTNYRRRFAWVAHKQKLVTENASVLAKLTAASSGYCFFEAEFELSTGPLAISSVPANR